MLRRLRLLEHFDPAELHIVLQQHTINQSTVRGSCAASTVRSCGAARARVHPTGHRCRCPTACRVARVKRPHHRDCVQLVYSFGSGWLKAISTYPNSGLLLLYICEKMRLNIALGPGRVRGGRWRGGKGRGLTRGKRGRRVGR
jgi:hypothetical protein